MVDERKDKDNDEGHRDRAKNDEQTARNKESSKKVNKQHEYGEWNQEDLLQKAGELGIEGHSDMDKQELIKAIRDH